MSVQAYISYMQKDAAEEPSPQPGDNLFNSLDNITGKINNTLLKAKTIPENLERKLSSKVTGLVDPASVKYSEAVAGEGAMRALRQSMRDKGKVSPEYLTPEALADYSSTPALRRSAESAGHAYQVGSKLWDEAAPENKLGVARGALQFGSAAVPIMRPALGAVFDAEEYINDRPAFDKRVNSMTTTKYSPAREGSVSDFIRKAEGVVEPVYRPMVAGMAAIKNPKAFKENWSQKLNQAVRSGGSLAGVSDPYDIDRDTKYSNVKKLMADQNYDKLKQDYRLNPKTGINYLNKENPNRRPEVEIDKVLNKLRQSKLEGVRPKGLVSELSETIKPRTPTTPTWAGIKEVNPAIPKTAALLSYLNKAAADCLAAPADGGIEYPINRMDLSGREDNDVKTVPELKPVLKPKKKPTLNTATGSFATNNN